MNSSESFLFLPLGGLGEIGLNLGLYGVCNQGQYSWLAVDFGIGFARDGLPGIDAVLPDIRFLESEKHNLQGIVITHAHEDHYGALPDLWERLNVPVYATPFAAAMLEAKLSFTPFAPKINIQEIPQHHRWQVGPFDLELIPMSHSIPEPNALAIHTKYGAVLHTGDWKVDTQPVIGKALDVERLKNLGDEGVLALICDSTNAMRDGFSPSEVDVAAALFDMISTAKNRVAVTTFASNVARLRTIMKATQQAGRHAIFVGRSMYRVATIAHDMGYFEGLNPPLPEEKYKELPRNKVVVVCTGSQGEDRAALARISWQAHPTVKLAAGDRVIFSSRTIPGNEFAVNGIINRLVDQKIDVKTDQDGLIHVSGHPRRGELAQMYEWTRPQIIVPAHGEPQHLAAHAAFAKQSGIEHVLELRNGQIAKLAPQSPAIVDDVYAGRIYRTGHLVVEAEESGLHERRKLSFAGCVFVSLVLSPMGDILDEPVFHLCGLPEMDASGRNFEHIVLDAIDDALDALSASQRKNLDRVVSITRRYIRTAVHKAWGKKPMCQVMVHMI